LTLDAGTEMKNKTLQPYIWILVSGFAFSWMVVFAKVAGSATNWQVIAIARCAIPLVLIAAWARWDGAQLVLVGPRILWIRSLAGSLSLVGTFYVIGTGLLPVTDIYTVSNIFPIWVALLSWPMLGRFPNGMVWLSIVSSIAGVALIQGAELQGGNFGVLIIVGVSLFTAIAMMGLNQLKSLDPRAVVVHFSATALVVALASIAFLPWEESVEFTPEVILLLLGIGVTASVGQFFLTKAFTAGDPARMSVATLSQFVFVFALDVLVLNSPLVWHKMWGIPLILGPTVWLMAQRVKTSALASAQVAVAPEPMAAVEPAWAVGSESAVSSESKS
jgi:drug/metabolite transporter (DMT)-like permease